MRIVSLVLVALLVATFAYAAPATNTHSFPAATNVKVIDGEGELSDPVVYIKRVRYGVSNNDSPTVVSGTALKWDTTSADGLTVSVCSAVTDIIAGVAVTSLLTQDNSASIQTTDNWGYMAVEGYALALVDTSVATTGQPLCLGSASNLDEQYGYLGTLDLATQNAQTSRDVGMLLTDNASDGLMRVYLNCR